MAGQGDRAAVVLEGRVGGFLSQLSRDVQAAFRASGRPRRFRRGATLFSEGDVSDWMLLVEAGRVKLSSFHNDGREALIGVAGPGELLGELSAIDRQPRSATGTALDDVDAIVIGADDFAAFLERHPSAVLVVLRTISRRLRDADRKRVEFGAYDTVSRVAAAVVELAERFGEQLEGGIRITLPLSQEELAGWTGSSREAVVKALRTLRNRGWIETRRREIRVLDLDALSRQAT